MSWSRLYVDRLVPAMTAAADPARAAVMAGYMRNQFEFLGIQSPGVRRVVATVRNGLARPSEADLVDLVHALWTFEPREYQYVGTGEVRRCGATCTPGFLPVVERLITTRSWWDTVDVLAVHGAGVLVASHPELRTEMERWLAGDNLWLRRSALLHQLLWRDRTDADWLFGSCLRLSGERDFFIRKAIGWALREYSKTDADAVQAFIAANSDVLAALSRREALLWLARHRD